MVDEPSSNGAADDADDDDDAGASRGIAAAFAAPPTAPKTNITSPAFNDAGEPDFAAWLNARTQGKSKPSLPKGMAKKPATPMAAAAAVAATSGGTTAPALKKQAAAKPVAPAKIIDTKPKDGGDDEDGWGDAWD